MGPAFCLSAIMKPGNSQAAALVLLGAALAVSTSGCRQHADPSKVARVRVIDVAPGPEQLDFAVDLQTVARHVKYQSNSGYIALDPGQYSLRVKTEDSNLRDEVSGELERGMSYTVLALAPRGDALSLKVIREDAEVDSPKDRAALRFIDASNTPALSLAIDNVVAVDNLKRLKESRPLTLVPGDYEVKLWTGDDTAQLFGPTPIHLDPGRAYTLIAMGRRADGTLTLQNYRDN